MTFFQKNKNIFILLTAIIFLFFLFETFKFAIFKDTPRW